MVPIAMLSIWGPIDIHDVNNFPKYNRDQTLEQYKFAVEHVNFMRDRCRCCWPTDQVYCDIWLNEAIWCKDVWDKFDDAVLYTGKDYPNPEAAEYALSRLRELLGPEAYYQGFLPPPVPTWMYPRTK